MIVIENQKYKDWINSSDGKGWLTFFTPSYNRAKFLPRLFDCLKAQTNRNFVWILVCDGSSDNTDDVAKELLDQEVFPMLYISKENGGKHSAFKVALESTKTEFFICMDDDDMYSKDSVNTFLQEWDRINNEGKSAEIGAIRTLARKSDGKYASNIPVIIGERCDATTLERTYVQHVYQENWTCYRTEALESIDLFPDNYWLKDQHKFFLEGIWQGRFARKYKCRYYNVCLREYTDDAETSLMRANKSRNHYLNMFINEKMILDEQLDYIRRSPKHLLQDVLLVGVLRAKLKISFRDLQKHTPNLLLKTLFFITAPVCYLSPKPKIAN